MGAKNSKINQLQETITNVAMDVVIATSSSASGSIDAGQDVYIAGNVKDVDITQNASIQLEVLQDTQLNASMQAELINKIMAAISENSSGLPEIQESNSESDIHTIVENNIKSNFSVSAVTDMLLEINMSQDVMFAPTAFAERIRISQAGEAMGSIVNSLGADIVNELLADSDLSADSDKKDGTLISGAIDSVSAGVTGAIGAGVDGIRAIGDIFGFSDGMIVLFFAIVILGFIISMKKLKTSRDSGLPGYQIPGTNSVADILSVA